MSIFQEFQLKKRKRKFYHFFGVHFWCLNLDIEVKYSYYSKCLETLWTFKRKIRSSCQKYASSTNSLRLLGKLSFLGYQMMEITTKPNWIDMICGRDLRDRVLGIWEVGPHPVRTEKDNH